MTVGASDLNHDGILDLTISYAGCHTPCEGVSLMTGNGDGTFNPVNGIGVSWLFYTPPMYSLSADFNGDGIGDVAAVASDNDFEGMFNNQDKVLVWTGNADGSFAQEIDFNLGSRAWPHSLITADFDRNGRPDLAVANTGINTVTVLLNAGVHPGSYGDFEVGPIATGLTVGRESSTTTGVLIDPLGYQGTIALSCSGLPTGVNCSFNPPTVTNAGNTYPDSTLTLKAGSAAATGSYTFMIVGKSGGNLASRSMTVTVQ